MIENKILKLLQKTITTLMCFWMLTTQMPINVVFADEINTEENIVEDINNNVDNVEEDQTTIEEDVETINKEDDEIIDSEIIEEAETETSINQELIDNINNLLNTDIVNITNIDELTNVHDDINNVIDEYNELSSDEQINIDYDSLLSFKYDVTKLLIDRLVDSLPSEDEINTFDDVQKQIAPTRKLVRSTIPNLISELNEEDQTNYNNQYNSLLSDITTFLANRQKQIMNGEAVTATTRCGVTADWKAYSENDFPTKAGCYYLTSDITSIPDREINSGTVRLDLNGHTITFEYTGSGRCPTPVYLGGGNLYLYDSSTNKTGKITRTSATVNERFMYVQSTSSNFYMYGGTITNFTSGSEGGAIYINGKFEMYGGTISYNTSSKDGGGVYVNNGGTFIMHDGTICNNTASANGGGVYVKYYNSKSGAFTMNGGTISSNKANYGGGVYIYTNGKFDMYGGTFSHNTATYDGGGIYDRGGATYIHDGTFGEGNSAGGNGKGIYYTGDITFMNMSIYKGRFYIYSSNGYIDEKKHDLLANRTNTISFNQNGGSGNTPSLSSSITWNSTLPNITSLPTRTGYTFYGYYNAASGGDQYYNANGVAVRTWDYIGAQTLYAHWIANKYTVTLDNQNATEVGSTLATATYNSAMPKIDVPTRTGYTFVGYFDAETGGTQYYNSDGSSTKNWDKTSDTTLYAKWTAKTSNVSLDGNGTTNTGHTTSTTATYGSPMPNNIILPTRDGYTFAGYFDAKEDGTKYYNSDISNKSARNWDKEDANVTLYAQWNIITKSVTLFQYDTSQAGSTSVTVTYGSTMPTITPPSRAGYTFNGYFTLTDGKGTKYYNADGTSARVWNDTSVVSLYAYWTVNSYVITFNANGGTGGTTSINVDYGAAMPSITLPTKEGYEFAGYYDDSINGTQYYTSAGASARNWDKEGNATLYAHWVAKTDTKYVVNHYKQNIDLDSYTLFETDDLKGTTDATITPSVKSYTGFTAPSVKQVTINSDGSTVVDYYYTRNKYNITYALDGGSLGTNQPTNGIWDVSFVVDNPTKTGYKFAGWNITGMDSNTHTYGSYTTTDTSINTTTATTFNNLNATNNSTVTFTATWTNSEYTVTLDAQGGTPNTSTITATYGYDMPSATVPTKTGYVFLGYFDAQTDGNKYYDADGTSAHVWDKAEDTTLYAQWSTNKYTVVYNGNGSTDGSTESSIHEYDVKKQLTANGYSRSYTVTYNANEGNCYKEKDIVNYSFGGWNTKADGTGTSYVDQELVTNLTSTNDGIVNLYAKWNSESAHLPTPTRNGYKFDGWYTKDNIYVGKNGENYTPESTITLYAHWTIDTYIVTLKPGNGDTNKTIEVHYNDDLNSITPPKKTGYTFTGYYDEVSGGNKYYKEDGTPNSKWNKTSGGDLYAHWSVNPSDTHWVAYITPNANDEGNRGTLYNGLYYYDNFVTAIDDIKNGQTITLLQNVELTEEIHLNKTNITLDLNNKILSGRKDADQWQKGDIFSYDVEKLHEPIPTITIKNGTIKYYWQHACALFGNYNVTSINVDYLLPYNVGWSNDTAFIEGRIDIYGGSIKLNRDSIPESGISNENRLIKLVRSNDYSLYVHKNTYGGSEFVLESTNIGTGIVQLEAGKYIDGIENINQYRAPGYVGVLNTGADSNKYKYVVVEGWEIDFNSNGGSKVDTQYIEKGSKVTKPTDPEKDNYIFDGWYTDNETFKNKWDFDNDIPTEDTVLYAKWLEPVASVNHNDEITIYTSLQDAFDAANLGDTVTLLVNQEVSSKLTIPENVTLTFNDGTCLTINEEKTLLVNGTLLMPKSGYVPGVEMTLEYYNSVHKYLINNGTLEIGATGTFKSNHNNCDIAQRSNMKINAGAKVYLFENEAGYAIGPGAWNSLDSGFIIHHPNTLGGYDYDVYGNGTLNYQAYNNDGFVIKSGTSTINGFALYDNSRLQIEGGTVTLGAIAQIINDEHPENNSTFTISNAAKAILTQDITLSVSNRIAKELLNTSLISGDISKRVVEKENKNAVEDVISYTYSLQDLIEISIPTAITGLTYNGSEQIGVAKGVGYTLTNNTATNAGEHIAIAKLDNGYTWSDGTRNDIEITYSISEASFNNVTATSLEYTYNGEPQGESNNVSAETVDSSSYTINYLAINTGDYSLSQAPKFTDTGTHSVYYQITAANHKTETGSYNVVINKKDANITANNLTKFYGANIPTLTATVEGTVNNEELNYSLSTTITKNSEVGNYENVIIVSYDPNNSVNRNYNITTNPGSFEIIRATFIVETKDSTFTYNGELQGDNDNIVSITSNSGTLPQNYYINYGIDENNILDNIAPKFKDAGKHVVYYKVSGDYHTDLVGTYNVVINPLDIAEAEITLKSYDRYYSGIEIIPGVNSVVVNGLTVPGYLYESEWSNNKFDENDANIDTKEASVTVKVTTTGNFTGTATKTYEIERKTYYIDYDLNGGTNETDAPRVHKYGIDTVLPSNPTKAGYSFVGWNTQADGKGTSYAPGATYSLNQYVKLYAIWEVSYATVIRGREVTGANKYDGKDSYFTSLHEALNAVEDGDIVDLLRDIASEEGGWSPIIEKEIVFNLNNYTIFKDSAIYSLTIKNNTIINGSGKINCDINIKNGKATLNDFTIIGTINVGSKEATCVLNLNGINNGKTGADEGAKIYASENATVNVVNGTISRLYKINYTDGSNVFFNISGNAYFTGGSSSSYSFNEIPPENITITGGDFPSDVQSWLRGHYVTVKHDNNRYRVEEHVGDAVAKIESDNQLANAIEFDNGYSYYDTLAKAIKDATSTETKITLLKDVVEHNLTIEANQNVTLDLNGKTIDAENLDRLFVVRGSLTIDDSTATGDETNDTYVAGRLINGRSTGNGTVGTDDSELGNAIFVKGDGATLNINDGIIEDCTMIAGKGSGNGTVYATGDNSKVRFNGGVIRNCTTLKGGAFYIAGSYFEMTGGAIINCKSTYVDGQTEGAGAINLFCNTSLITGGLISGCEAAGKCGGIQIKIAKLTITGGVFENCTGGDVTRGQLIDVINDEHNRYLLKNESTGIKGSSLEITGGTFVGADNAKTNDLIHISSNDENKITGGWYSGDITPNEDYGVVGPINDAPDARAPYTVTNNIYKITYDSNGGNAIDPEKIYSLPGYSVKTRIMNEVPTKQGYKFSSWNTESNGTGTRYVAGDEITLTGDITLNAQWTEDYVTVIPHSIAKVSKNTLSSVGNIIGGGNNILRNVETQLSVVENPDSIYRFDHWEIDGKEVGSSKTLTYSFTEDTTDVYAVFIYDLQKGIKVHVESEKPFTMKVLEKQSWLFWEINLDATYDVSTPNANGLYDKTINIVAGSQVELEYTGDDFKAWTSESGMIESASAKYTMNAIFVEKNIKLEINNKVQSKHYAEYYVSDIQIISSGNFANLRELKDMAPSSGPGLVGYEFVDWAIGETKLGDIASDSQLEEIIKDLEIVEIRPVYNKLDIKHKVTVNTEVGTTIDKYSEEEYELGKDIMLTAPEKENCTFAYWKIGDEIVSYNEKYAVKVMKDVTLSAVYNVTADKKPTLTANVSTTGSGSNIRLAFNIVRNVPEDKDTYQLVDNGLLYAANSSWSKYSDSQIETALRFSSVDSEGNVKLKSNTYKAVNPSNSPIGTFTATIGISNVNRLYYLRGYMIVLHKKADGSEEMLTIYSDLYAVTYSGASNPHIIEVPNNN